MRARTRLLVEIVLLAAACTAVYLVFSGPRMRVQPSVRALERVPPPAPPGRVPVEAPSWRRDVPSRDRTVDARAGAVFYGYYCAFCHGTDGHGAGPVGRSYVPTPTDLSTWPATKFDDAEIARRMLSGRGHAPVLERVVLPEARSELVGYVRQLAADAPNGAR